MVGRTISHYHISEKLGGGGMGIVYKATDQRLDRTVALKFLPPHLSSDPEANERFIREAKAASALDHANICAIYDIGETEEGQLFIVMAFYEGQTLKYRLASGALPIDVCVDITLQIARGLERAHEAGIVHRDIKPPNVMVTDRGEVKVLDFGVAKLSEGEELTVAGSMVGTTPYMSPEQARGEEVDARTDVWALGVVLYQMLTGERPFQGDYRQAILYSVMNQDPEPVQASRSEVPEALVEVVNRALEKEPSARYADMTVLIEDLQSIQGVSVAGASSSSRIEEVPSKPRWMLVGVPVVLLVLIGIAWVVLGDRFASSNELPEVPTRTAIAVLPFDVQGGNELAYLKEGMVTLLATKLDGASTLRSVDPKALHGYLARNSDRVLDPEAGREAATHFGAGSFILGTVLDAGTETQLIASLYDAEGVELTEAQASFATDEQFIQAVDELAQQLVSVFLDEVDKQIASRAIRTTTSFTALKAFLEGEQALREGRYQQAAEAARQAVAADSTFALGWNLLRTSLGWISADPTRAEYTMAQERALQYSDGLPDRTKTLLQAQFDAANVEESERAYRDLLASYPDDIEAWGKLGDLLYHYNGLRGRSASEAVDAFERVLDYDPDNAEYSQHLMQLAGKERDYVIFDSIATRYLQTEDPYNTHRDLYWLVRGSPADQDSVMALYRSAPGILFAMEWLNLVQVEHIEVAQELAERYGDAAPSPEEQALGKALYIFTLTSRGQVERSRAAREAAKQLLTTYTDNPISAVFWGLLPYVSISPEHLDSLEQRVAAWDTTAAPYESRSGADQYLGHQGDIQTYLLGLLRWRQGDAEGTRGYAEALRQRAQPQAKHDYASSFARTLGGLVAWQEDRPEEALVALEEARLRPTFLQAMSSPLYAQVLARYARAEIFYAEGRYEEALSLYSSLHYGDSIQGLVYLGPSYLRRAEIYEHLGDTENAIIYYTRFLELWQDADPALQTNWVEPARQRLDRLVGDTTREPTEVPEPS